MKKPRISIQDTTENQNFHDMMRSMIEQKLEGLLNVAHIEVTIKKTEDKMVPFNVSLKSEFIESEPLEAQAASVNLLAAFSQAVARMERYFFKEENKRA